LLFLNEFVHYFCVVATFCQEEEEHLCEEGCVLWWHSSTRWQHRKL